MPYKVVSKAISRVLRSWDTSRFFTLLNIVSYFAHMSAVSLQQELNDAAAEIERESLSVREEE